MTHFYDKPITRDQIWFGLLFIYTITGYFAQGVLLPSAINSFSLYAFLAFSALCVFLSGKIKFSSMLLWEIVILLLALFAMTYSHQGLNFGGTFYSMIVNFILIFMFTQMPWNAARFRFILKSYAFSAAVLFIALALTGNLEDSSRTGRLGEELMGNANILAMLLMIGAICALYLVVYARTAWTRALYLLLVCLIYVGMFLSGGRKFVIVPIIFVYIVLLAKTDKNGRKHILGNTALIAAILFVLYWTIMEIPIFYESIGKRFDGFFALFDGRGETDGSTKLRLRMIEIAAERWVYHPIFGHGFDGFKYYNQAHGTRYLMYSHNNFWELLFNQGLLGFCAYYSFYGYLLVKAMKNRKKTTNYIFAAAFILSLLFFEYFGVTYESTQIQFMLFFCWYNLNVVEADKPAESNALS